MFSTDSTRITARSIISSCVLLLGCVWLVTQTGLAEDIIFMGEPPVTIRLNLKVDGKPWSETRRGLAKRQFQIIDGDKDGLIEVDQLQGIALPKFDPTSFEEWDTETKDGKLSETEFLNVFEKAGESPFLLAEGAGRASSRVKLFAHLDSDSNGRLTEDEYSKAKSSLARLDYDDDETISTAELSPFVNPLVQQAFVGRETPLASDAPFISVADFPSLSDVAVVMLRRYGDRTSDETTNSELRCAIGRLGKEREVKPFDADGDGQLNHQETIKYLTARKPEVELEIDLPAKTAKRPKMKLKQDRIKASKRRVPARGSSRIDLQAANTDFNVRAQSSTAKYSDNRNFYLSQMLIADADKNRYLDANEFPAVGLPADFKVVDADGDEKVVRDELSAYLDRDAFATQSQVVLSVASGSRTLFTELDTDYDQRLTQREFKEIGKRLKSLDKNGDNSIEANEISQEYRLSFSMGRPRIFQQAMMQQGSDRSGGPSSSTTPNSDAPDWYQRMDRNQDGDLSWREFLGTRDQFEKLDTDSDGLVTVGELEQ